MRWINFFHIYQPPEWNEEIVRKATKEAYWPLYEILDRHRDVHITLNIGGSLIEQLLALGYDNLLAAFARLAERGQIEFVGSAMYHPILPLIPPDEARRQIEIEDELKRRVFGAAYKPTGFFPPEMAFCPELEQVLLDLGYRWVILDEIALTKNIGTASFDKNYQTSTGLGVVVRNRHISDYLSFSAKLDKHDQVLDNLCSDARSKNWLITAMDGENLGHHRPGVDRLWQFLVAHPKIKTVTVSEYRRALPKTVTPVQINPASWSSRPDELLGDVPFGLWQHPDNEIHRAQWELIQVIIKIVHRAAADANFPAARKLLDRALTSDKFWWASASPWWDLTIVIRETQRLADVIEPLDSVPAAARNRVSVLLERVATTAELWEKTGLARRRQTNYLKKTSAIHYMGGRQVTT